MTVAVRAMAVGLGACFLPQITYKAVNNYIIIKIIIKTAQVEKTRSVCACCINEKCKTLIVLSL